MNPRTRSAGVALALVVSLAGTGAATTSADAIPSASVTHRVAEKAAAVVVDVTVGKNGITRSANRFRPGNTLFNIRSAGLRGSIELVRLRQGYTLKMLRRDFGKSFSGDLKALRRINHRAIFYGGMPVRRTKTTQFGTKLRAGKYFLVNIDRNMAKPLLVTGSMQARSLPPTDGVINMTKGNRFKAPGPLPKVGWLEQTNKSDEPHFMVLNKVKRSTTKAKVRRFLASGAQGEPRWALAETRQTLLISPGHTIKWHYNVTGGKYLALCFWSDEETGRPHVFMGMWNLFMLR
jgi:hypothetical protein